MFKKQASYTIPPEIQSQQSHDPLMSMLYIVDCGLYTEAEDHFCSRINGCEENILIFCVKGEGWCIIDSERKAIKKNDFILIKGDTPHTYASSAQDPWSIYWLRFKGEKCALFNDAFNKVDNIASSTPAQISDRISIFEDIMHNIQNGYSTDNLCYTSLCLWHLLGSFRYTHQYCTKSTREADDPTQRAINFMKQNLDKSLTLHQIANNIKYSSSHFGALFLKSTGHSPIEYFNHLRIQEACNLLDFTPKAIKEIASIIGFNNQYYFSKVFSKVMGTTPSQYRKREKS